MMLSGTVQRRYSRQGSIFRCRIIFLALSRLKTLPKRSPLFSGKKVPVSSSPRAITIERSLFTMLLVMHLHCINNDLCSNRPATISYSQ